MPPELDPVGRASRYEEVVLGWVRGDGTTALTAGLWLLFTSLLTCLFVTLVGWQVHENVALERRGEVADARVVRTNYDGRSPTLNLAYESGPVGVTAIMDSVEQRPGPGDVIQVRYDPHHPSVVREVSASIWRWIDFLPLPFAVAGGLVVPAELMRFRRRLRERRA
ncbi:DUF3592 domain-containing protein [Asanoa iriomotensis]|uniref:DUF3592 domain-containing protein n=1 Tax=Asanoa iriomotensis TaxID=234613 RepID=A0ABQ4C2A4_9ACTN|nr:DUF3592 domain-containing protein [Asanoa iriomotensis]GIF56561.1 hypothetical protein Air01nite_26560 [Asanoa iriomotensis]